MPIQEDSPPTGIPAGINCANCMYPLHTLYPGNNCPECGHAILPLCTNCAHPLDAQSINDHCPSCDTMVHELLKKESVMTVPIKKLRSCKAGIGLILLSSLLLNLLVLPAMYGFMGDTLQIEIRFAFPLVLPAILFFNTVGWFKVLSVQPHITRASKFKKLLASFIRVALILVILFTVAGVPVHFAMGPAGIVYVLALVLLFLTMIAKAVWINITFSKHASNRQSDLYTALAYAPIGYLLLCMGSGYLGLIVHASLALFAFIVFCVLHAHINTFIAAKSHSPT